MRPRLATTLALAAVSISLAPHPARCAEIPSNDGRAAKIVALGQGEWFVGWQDSSLYIACARLDSQGNILYGPARIDRAGMSPDFYNGALAFTGSQIGWAYSRYLGSSYDAWFHLLDRDGHAVSAPVQLSNDAYPSFPIVHDMVFRDGQFLVGYSYAAYAGNVPAEARARLVDAGGALASPEIVMWRSQPGEAMYGPSVERLGSTLVAAWLRYSTTRDLVMAMADPQGNVLVPATPYVTPSSGGGLWISSLVAQDDRFALVFIERPPGSSVQPLEMIQLDDQGLVLQGRTAILNDGLPTGGYATTRSGDGLATSYVRGYGGSTCPCVELDRIPGDATFLGSPLDISGSSPGFFTDTTHIAADTSMYGIVREEHDNYSNDKIFFDVAAHTSLWAAGAGPSPSATAEVRVLPLESAAGPVTILRPYASPGYGCEVGSGELDGDTEAEILSAPGPATSYGPQIRAFQWRGPTIAKVNFFAYGTLHYGAKVSAGPMDADPYDEILSTPGPGVVFGPHVRGFDFDNATVRPMTRLSFYVYGTLRYGANAAAGDVDGDGYAEILTGPGPGAVFGAQLRGFDYDGAAVSAMSKVNAIVFPSSAYGLVVASGNTDADGSWEIAAAQGPAAAYGNDVGVYDYDGSALSQKAGSPFQAFPGATRGARIAFVNWMDRDATDELLVSRGPSPAASSEVRVADDATASFASLASYDPYPGATHGTTLAGLSMGF